MSSRMPVIFFGHGNPLNALFDNAYTRSWRSIGDTLPRPRAVLCISAHWYIGETAVTAMPKPRTIHDFGGFPQQLYEVQYGAPGNEDLARQVQSLLSPTSVVLDHDWGLDHGTWSVLCHVFPNADIPVVQLSLDESRPPSFHYELAKRLSSLRDENVLIIGSGNVVHNLHAYAWGKHNVDPYDWAVRFEEKVRQILTTADPRPLVEYESLGPDAVLSVPTPDHYLPLLYTLAVRREDDAIDFPVQGFDGGSVSMLSARFS